MAFRYCHRPLRTLMKHVRTPHMQQCLSASTLSSPPRSTMNCAPNDYSGVLTALSHYFDALHLRDPERMKMVWHPSAHLKRPGLDGTLVDINADRFLQIVGEATGEAPADQHAKDRVLSIDFAGPSTVMAKVQIQLGQTLYTDFLSLLLLSEGWRIIAKLFASRDAEASSAVDSTPPAYSHSELSATLSEYINACRTSDAKRLQAVLHPSCQTFAVRVDGELREVSADAFVERTGGFYTPLPLGVGVAKYNRIVSIDKSGPLTACATVQTGYALKEGQLAVDPHAGPGEWLFTNHLMLTRLGGGWSVVSRTYSPEVA